MSRGDSEYIFAAVAYMRASHLKMLIYDLRHMGSNEYMIKIMLTWNL